MGPICAVELFWNQVIISLQPELFSRGICVEHMGVVNFRFSVLRDDALRIITVVGNSGFVVGVPDTPATPLIA